MASMLIDWRSAASAWLSAWVHGAVMSLPLILLVIVLDAPPWMLVFLWAYPFGRMSYDRMHAVTETADKPFSFGLPGYRESLRKSSFFAALCLGLGTAPFGLVLWWAMASRHGGPTPIGICIHLVNGFLVGAAASLCINGDLRLVVSRMTYGLIQVLSIPLFFIGVVVAPAFVVYPALGIPSAITVWILMWVGLGDTSRVKRGHRMILEDALEWQAQVGVTKTASPWVEGLFQRLLKHLRRFDYAKYIWGSLYRSFGMTLSHWKWIVAPYLLGILILGYAGRLATELGFLVFSSIMTPVVVAFGAVHMLLPEGRQWRLLNHIVVAAVTSLLLVALAAGIIALSYGLAVFMPTIPRDPRGLEYLGLSIESLWMACLPVPWLSVLSLSPFGVPVLRGSIVSAAAILSIGGIFARAYGLWDCRMLHPSLLLCGWLFLILTLWITYRRRDLIG